MTATINRRILIVDDTPSIHEDIRGVLAPRGVDYSEVEALERSLFAAVPAATESAPMELDSAHQGEEALALVKRSLEQQRPYAVAFVDMRMPPGWDGLQTITELWRCDPDLQVVICTAYSDHSWADIALRLGVRDNLLILKKPFDSIEVIQLAQALTAKWSLREAERELLERTLQGSIKVLIDVLALTNPQLFGRAERVRQLVAGVLDHLDVKERWPIEIAAMLSQLGWIALPAETAARAQSGAVLSSEDEAMLSRVPLLTDELLKNIPRLERVRAIVGEPAPGSVIDPVVVLGRALLKIATEFDLQRLRGVPARFSVEALRKRGASFDAPLLQLFATVHGFDGSHEDIREIPIRSLHAGMMLADDLLFNNGVLLAPRGYEVTVAMVERLRNFKPGVLKESVRIVDGGPSPGAATGGVVVTSRS